MPADPAQHPEPAQQPDPADQPVPTDEEVPADKAVPKYGRTRLYAGLVGRSWLWFVVGCLAITLIPILFGWRPYVVESGAVSERYFRLREKVGTAAIRACSAGSPSSTRPASAARSSPTASSASTGPTAW